MQHQSKPLALAINYINQFMDTECIFCYGTRVAKGQTASLFTNPMQTVNKSIHFDLLAITSNTCNLPDFIGKIDNIDNIDITVTLIAHTHYAVQQALKENNRFFHSVIKNGALVDSGTGKLPINLTAVFNQEEDDHATLGYWKNCLSSAVGFSDLAFNSSGDNHIAIPLLKKSMQQACLGLIYVFFGYQPEGYELDELLELCNSVDLRSGELVPLVTEKERFNYRILIDGFWNGEYGEGMEPDIAWIHGCCDQFIAYAKELCCYKLQLMEVI